MRESGIELVASCMCPNQELNQQPFGHRMTFQPPEPHQPGQEAVCLLVYFGCQPRAGYVFSSLGPLGLGTGLRSWRPHIIHWVQTGLTGRDAQFKTQVRSFILCPSIHGSCFAPQVLCWGYKSETQHCLPSHRVQSSRGDGRESHYHTHFFAKCNMTVVKKKQNCSENL